MIYFKNSCLRIELLIADEDSDEETLETPRGNDEMEIIRRDINGNKIELLFLLSLWTGIRRGEALALTFSDMDLEKGKISINKT